ncbi:uncharacterized protein Tco025E_06344 [Trypanosoma conorhini]|uniref:Uncharacterized protein n=1 Tax=Trypanosoma conorhini TaxID=83891 RepID=A0A422P6M6_9TRYP|nr:uncharacterized protein Tco025E_06344 [Trypanosoma conorhini]RNF13314.1 hypothetical protein Tco025E_06344 [Trypanosoma conorhini]
MQVNSTTNRSSDAGSRLGRPSAIGKMPLPVVEKRGLASTPEAASTAAAPGPAADGTMNTSYNGSLFSHQATVEGENAAPMWATRNSLEGIRGCSLKRSPEVSLRTASKTHSALTTKREGASALFMQASSMSSTLRREQAVMGPELYLQLCYERQLRRHNPKHGFDKTGEDYIYYNHRSKGCYIPRRPRKGTLTLTYNHMFDFTDGSRFLCGGDAEPPRPNPNVVNTHTGDFKSLVKRDQKELAESAFLKEGYSIPAHSLTLTSPQRSKSQAAKTISVDLARSLQVSDLRIKPFQRRVMIEDVIAKDSRRVAKVMDGVSSVVAKGKVKLNDVPENLRRALSEEQVRHTATLESTKASALTTGYYMNETGSQRYATELSPAPGRTWQKGEPHRPPPTPEQTTKRPNVSFTDHADRVLLGFTENVLKPVISKDGGPSYQLMRMREEEAKEEAEVEGIAKSDTVDPTQQHPQEANTTQALPSLPASKELPVLLPPIAIAAMRDAEWFDPVGLAKSKFDEAPPSWSARPPEKPLPFETSRLDYIRNYDAEAANPPEAMMHWTQAKTLL